MCTRYHLVSKKLINTTELKAAKFIFFSTYLMSTKDTNSLPDTVAKSKGSFSLQNQQNAV